jgi:hypothetical protein
VRGGCACVERERRGTKTLIRRVVGQKDGL